MTLSLCLLLGYTYTHIWAGESCTTDELVCCGALCFFIQDIVKPGSQWSSQMSCPHIVVVILLSVDPYCVLQLM